MPSIRWERGRGWPLQVAIGLLGAGGLLLLGGIWVQPRPGWLALADWLLVLGGLLAWTRRVLELTLHEGEWTLSHGWGLQTPWGTRRFGAVSLPLGPLKKVWVEAQTEHYKGVASFHAVVAGEGPLKRRILDDEYPSQAAAQSRAAWLAAQMGLPLA